MKKFLTDAAALSILICPILSAQAASTEPSEALATCLYQQSSSADRQVLLQWAYVSLAKTSAAKKVQPIADSKIRTVEQNAQKTLSTLVLNRCSAPAMKVLLKDPKDGLQKTLASLSQQLVNAEIKRRTSPLLSMTITDLMKR